VTHLCEDIYIKQVTGNGAVTFRSHRVWDRARFLDSQKKDAKKEGNHVEQVTRDEYMRNLKK
jgi:hypothetical protein